MLRYEYDTREDLCVVPNRVVKCLALNRTELGVEIHFLTIINPYELDGRHDLPDKIELAVDIKVIISTLTNEIVWVTVPDY